MINLILIKKNFQKNQKKNQNFKLKKIQENINIMINF